MQDSVGVTSYSWDYENRLTKVKLLSDSSDVAEYTYDALGRRVEKVDQTGETDVATRWYLDRWSALEERDGDDALQATYINGPRIDEYLVMVRGGNTSWYCQSPIVGNVAALLDSTGAVKEGYTYRAYGSPTIHTSPGDDETWFTSDDPTAASSSVGNPYLFTGREWDEDISLQYSRARWYAPIPGRWLSRDPVGYWDSMNLCEYVRGRPQRLGDPFGLRLHPFARGEYRYHRWEPVREHSISGRLYAWDMFKQGLHGYPIDQVMEYKVYYLAGCKGLNAVFDPLEKKTWSNVIGAFDNWSTPLPVVGDYLGLSVSQELFMDTANESIGCPDGWRGSKLRATITLEWDEVTTPNLLFWSLPESARPQGSWSPDGSYGPSAVTHTIIVDCCCPPEG